MEAGGLILASHLTLPQVPLRAYCSWREHRFPPNLEQARTGPSFLCLVKYELEIVSM